MSDLPWIAVVASLGVASRTGRVLATDCTWRAEGGGRPPLRTVEGGVAGDVDALYAHEGELYCHGGLSELGLREQMLAGALRPRIEFDIPEHGIVERNGLDLIREATIVAVTLTDTPEYPRARFIHVIVPWQI